MRNVELERLLADDKAALDLDPHQTYRFCLRCVESVEANLESDLVLEYLREFRGYVESGVSRDESVMTEFAGRVFALARSHPGSTSIDGSRHAAVSATHTLAAAVAGRVVDAAAYAAYSQVYGYGGYALSDPSNFEAIHRQQVGWWRELQKASDSGCVANL
jgi:hypothetical protein